MRRPPPSPPARPAEGRYRWVGTAGAAALLVAFWAAFWPRGKPEVAPPAPGAEAPAPGEAAPGEAARHRPSEEDVVPMPGCFRGLREFDRHATLADLRAAILRGGLDQPFAEYLRGRLAELIGGAPERARAVLAWAKEASGAELEVLLGAIKDSAAVHDPGVAESLLATGEDKAAATDLRAAALDALETQHKLEPATMARLKAIALDDGADAPAWLATRTLGRVMKEDFEHGGSFEPYWRELLAIGQTSRETQVQLLALEMPSYADPVLGRESIDALAQIMRTDPDRAVREMAAHRLSVTKDPDKVLAIYRQAFPAERDECVRWAIFRFTVRVAGAGALPLLAEFAAIDRRFKEDHQDFVTLYASGTTDFARIWTGKEERHQCLGEEGEER
ncbi:MAG TPA: HEAT repeat domain-containing protein [Polyangiaceae bacterium]|nr:HEAT repeat domain-containing protein [Polyangiaceae bacterium]